MLPRGPEWQGHCGTPASCPQPLSACTIRKNI
ncbi:hypothetical protein QTO34_006220 [Cnephaeus nilssonii]|uniref:Uncharacterized protein n=1 Tax=Cnephaeus nilssonii TaxID=3371016 RepID=A0AA40HMB8_CNENI|nr:hypothetical protein QTO34_006220 [Eptesicus nilssonii]